MRLADALAGGFTLAEAVTAASASPAQRRAVLDYMQADAIHLLPSLEGQRILVAAAGLGVEVEQLADDGARVTAVDHVSEHAEITAARTQDRGVAVHRGRVADLPDEAEAFDAAVALIDLNDLAASFQRTDWVAELRAIRKRLRRDGQVLVRVRGRERKKTMLGRLGSARWLRAVLAEAGLRAATHAYGLPEREFPRYMIEARMGPPSGWAFLMKHVIDLGQQRPGASRLQPLMVGRIQQRVVFAASPVLVAVAKRADHPADGGDVSKVIMSGYRPFGGSVVCAEVDRQGDPIRITKIARTAAARHSLSRELNAVDDAREVFERYFRVPLIRMVSDHTLEVEAFRGTRLSALISGGGARRARLAEAATDAARRLACVVEGRISDTPLQSVAWDPTLERVHEERVREFARRRGLETVITAPAHGDLQPSNLIVGDDAIGLIDWEYFSQRVPVGFDLMFLLTEITRLTRRATVDEQWLVAHELVPCIQAFLSASGIGRETLLAYVPLFAATRETRAEVFDRTDRPRDPVPDRGLPRGDTPS